MRLPTVIGGLAAILWCAGSLFPHLLAGELWGMVWFMMNEPLSGWVEHKWGIGSTSYGLIAGVTIVNALIIGTVIGGVTWLARRGCVRPHP